MSGNKIIDGLNDALAFFNGDSERGRLETRFTRFTNEGRPQMPPNFSGPLAPRFLKLVGKPVEGD